MKNIPNRLFVFCLMLWIAQGCSQTPEEKAGAPGTGSSLDINVICRFVSREEGENAPLRVGIACISRVPIHADIGYRTHGSGPVWIPIKTNVSSEKLEDNKYVVRCLWDKPSGLEQNVTVKVTAVSGEGKEGSRTVPIDCIRPESRVTFDPFSM